MLRILQLALVLTIAIPAAGCTTLAMAKQRLELKAIEREWGFHKPDPYNPSKPKL